MSSALSSPAVTAAEADAAMGPELDRWMSAHVRDYAGPLEIERFSGGQSNPTFRLATPRRAYVMRRKPLGKLLPSAHAVDREYRVMGALHDVGFPVPQPYGYCEDEAVAGAPFYVMSLVEGRIFRSPLLPGCSVENRREVYRSLVRTLATLHSYDPGTLGLGDYGRPGNYMARQLKRWIGQYRASEDRRSATMERLIAWLPEHVPVQQRTSIVHGDMKVDNTVFDETGPKVAALLDWELSTIGDPLCDFTYLAMTWLDGPLSQVPDLEKEGYPTLQELVSWYCSDTGRDSLPQFDWFVSYNLFRLAAIIQGILGRVRDGTANAPDAAALAERVEPMAEASWRFAERAGAA